MTCPRPLGLLALVAIAGCAKKEAAQTSARGGTDAAIVPPVTVPEPLPAGATDGAVGVAGPARFLAAADDGSWVLVCQGERPNDRLRVVVGDGPGLEVDRAVATSERDLVVIDGDALVHVDVVARTWRRLGPRAVATVDPTSRRIVVAGDDKLIVHDPGLPPRTVAANAPVGAIWARSKRWVQVKHGAPPRDVAEGSCGWVSLGDHNYEPALRVTIDLDPSGVEAVDRVGPELGITAAGEVTLDGAVVVGADCVGNVIAALADPPRALVMCGKGPHHVVGPGFDKTVGGYLAGGEQATIQEHLTLGERLICVSGACIDLVTGRDYDTYGGADHVWDNARRLVRKRGGGLVVDTLDEEGERVVALPRVTQAVTVDTATGQRRAGPAPAAATYIDGAGDFLLYGRYVVDTAAAELVATLPDEALAIDRRGRVLVAAGPGTGPLRWRVVARPDPRMPAP